MKNRKKTSQPQRNEKKAEETHSSPLTRGQRFLRRVCFVFRYFIRFVTKDVWHITEVTGRPLKRLYINSLKSIYMAVKGFIDLDLSNKASALTYSTALSIVPVLAVIIGVAKGFGFQQTVYDFLQTYMSGHTVELQKTFQFVDNYLSQVQGGVFLGIGLIFLFYTIFNLLSSIESAFNQIWETHHSRSWKRKLVDYLAMLLILPAFMTVSSGITLMMATVKNSFINEALFITPVVETFFTLIPFVFIIFMFTAMFMWLPGARVRFLPAFIAGTLAGISFQIFQALYMTGLFWISKYNAIYGGFAAFPLLLLWIQLAWNIILFCSRLAFSIQNVRTFAYEKESNNISRRYSDFLTMVIMTHIVQRFCNDKFKEPHTVLSLSEACRLPISLTSRIVEHLEKIGLILRVHYDENSKEAHYHPSVDPEILTVGYLIQALDNHGTENFNIDMERYQIPWQLTLRSRNAPDKDEMLTLLRNLSF